MKRYTQPIFCIAIAVVAYCVSYFLHFRETKSTEAQQGAGLEWLKEEFDVSDAEFADICKEHEAYSPRCAHMRRVIEAETEELKRLVLVAKMVTPEIKAKLERLCVLRAECNEMMLHYFFSVSEKMPPEKAKQYLTQMGQNTSLAGPLHSNSH